MIPVGSSDCRRRKARSPSSILYLVTPELHRLTCGPCRLIESASSGSSCQVHFSGFQVRRQALIPSLDLMLRCRSLSVASRSYLVLAGKNSPEPCRCSPSSSFRSTPHFSRLKDVGEKKELIRESQVRVLVGSPLQCGVSGSACCGSLRKEHQTPIQIPQLQIRFARVAELVDAHG